LNCVDYLSATVTNGGCTSKRRAGYGKPFDTGKGGLKRIKIVCWFPFFGHTNLIHHYGVNGNLSKFSSVVRRGTEDAWDKPGNIQQTPRPGKPVRLAPLAKPKEEVSCSKHSHS
jgi:hypothetical protein